jgi:hypothetical protein
LDEGHLADYLARPFSFSLDEAQGTAIVPRPTFTTTEVTVKTAVLTFALALPLAARAADLPTSYTVNDTALKAAVAGTSLTFTLYSDAGCTQQVHQQAVSIENVNLVSRLKLFTPKSAPKGPKVDEVHETLTGVSAAGNLYLTVTGTGITPVGVACQAQAALVDPKVALPLVSVHLAYDTNLQTWLLDNVSKLALGFLNDVSTVVPRPVRAEAANVLLSLDTTLQYQCFMQASKPQATRLAGSGRRRSANG